MAQFGEEVKTKAILNTAGAPSPLGSVALGDVGLDQSAQLPLLIEPHLAMFARINDAGDVRNGDSSLRNVSRFCQRSVQLKSNFSSHNTYHDLANASPRHVKNSPLVFARDRGVQGVDDELGLGSESPVFGQHVVHTANFAHSGHENEDCGRVSSKKAVFETNALQQAKDKVVRDLALV